MLRKLFDSRPEFRKNSKNLMLALGALAAAAISNSAHAQQVQWHLTGAKGYGALATGCRMENIQSTAAGDNSSLVFDQLRVDLADHPSRHGAHASGYCDVAMALVIPKGQFLTTMAAQLLGGIVKSKGAMALLDVSYHLTRLPQAWAPALLATGPFGQIMRGSRFFAHRDELNEPLFTIDSSRTFNRVQQRQMCQWTRTAAVTVGFKSRISMAATRSRLEQQNILSVDGIDNTLAMATSTGTCP